jgi:branched-chain amino acid transport system permease protein
MKRIVPWLALLVVLVAIPFLAPIFWINVASQALIFAIFAMSLDLLLGYGGMPSFGHAAFYGAGAYAGALWALNRAPDLFPLLAVGLIAGMLLALPLGALALRASGIYFLMLTLALAQLLWGLATKLEITGKDIGLVGVPRPVPPAADQLGITLWLPRPFYLVVLALTVISFLVLLVVTRSPFGKTLEGIRENEHRMRALGCPTFRYRLAAFVVAGSLAGLAGVLAAAYSGNASPGQLFWTTSGLVLIAAIIGGTRSLIGPALGAVLLLILQTAIPSLTPRWPLLVGAVFIAFVLFLPGGIASVGRRLA